MATKKAMKAAKEIWGRLGGFYLETDVIETAQIIDRETGLQELAAIIAKAEGK